MRDVCEIGFTPEKSSESDRFPPLFQFADGRRTSIPADFRGKQSDIFSDLVPKINNQTLKARLADISWQNDRSEIGMAKHAVTAYTQSVREVLKKNHRKNNSVGVYHFLLRALQISYTKGSKVPETEISDLKQLVSEVANNCLENNEYQGFIRISRLRLTYSINEPADIANDTEILATKQSTELYHQRELWKLAIEAYHKSNNKEKKENSQIKAAECLINQAELFEGSGISAAKYLLDAIAELSQVPGTKQRRKEIEAKLIEVQKQIPDQMMGFSKEVDITPFVNLVRNCLGGLDLPETLREFAFLHKPYDPDSLKEQVQQLYEKNPIMAMMPIQVVDWEGRYTSKSYSPGEEGWVRLKIFEIERLCRQTAAYMIEQARIIIQSEHNIFLEHFRILAEHTCFIHQDKKDIIISGLEDFFLGKYISSLHILVPQLESSLRHVLKLADVNTSKLQNDMTQELLTFSQILNNENTRLKLDEIFGKELVFEMDNLFNYKGGPALRHRLSHGLLSDYECKGPDAIYACWFIYRFYFLSFDHNWITVKEQLKDIQ